MTRLALDLSNYTTNTPVPGSGARGGLITVDQINCWKANGYSHVIVGTQWPVVAAHQLAMCRDNGMTLDAYIWIWFDQDIETQVLRGFSAISGFPVRRVWIDIEDVTTNKGPQELIALTRRALEVATAASNGRSIGIYTARWYWPPRLANTSEFSYLPLWHAEYKQPVEGAPPSHVPSLDEFRPYGGWERPAMWQFAGSVQLCGTNQDFNVDYENAEPAPPIGEDDQMIGHVWTADWFEDRVLEKTPAGEFYVMQAQADFHLPEEAVKALFFVENADGDSGRSEWFNGGSSDYVGKAYRPGVNPIAARLAPARPGIDAGKTVNFRVVEVKDEQGNVITDTTRINRISCVGYWTADK